MRSIVVKRKRLCFGSKNFGEKGTVTGLIKHEGGRRD